MLKKHLERALFMRLKGIPRQSCIQILIGQVLLLINIPLSAIVYLLEAILFPGRVRSKKGLQGLVLK